MTFNFDDLERTLPPESQDCKPCASPKAASRVVYEPRAGPLARIRRAKCSTHVNSDAGDSTSVEAAMWKSLDPDLEAATRGFIRPEFDLGEIQVRRDVTAKLEESSHMPVISVICPTTGSRRHFHGFLWECYEAQTFPLSELIVIETSMSEPSEFWYEKARMNTKVVYRHYKVDDRKWSVGLKRNLACCFASGSVIAHFDDDDIYAPCYLASMVQRLLEPLPDATGAKGLQGSSCAKLASWVKYSIRYGTWGYCNPQTYPHSENYDHKDMEHCLYGWGFSLVYMRSAWLAHPFPHTKIGEDYKFVQDMRRAGRSVVLVKDAGKICAHTQHAGNTSGRLMEPSEPLSMAASVLAVSPLAPLLDRYLEVVDGFRAAQNLPRLRR